jgi:hypothetical protein
VRLGHESDGEATPLISRLAAPQKERTELRSAGSVRSADHRQTMSEDLAEARKTPLFNSAALTKLLWSPRSRTEFDKVVAILQNEPLFRKADKFNPSPKVRVLT